MPRQARIDIPGLMYHIIVRGIERSEIFPGKRDRADFINRLSISLEGSGAKCYAWAVEGGTESGSQVMNIKLGKSLRSYLTYWKATRIIKEI